MNIHHDADSANARNAGLDPDALHRLSSVIRSDIDSGRHFGASIIVARGGVIGHRETFGTVAPGRAAADDDVYLLMSVSKSFTAALVLQAVDQGRFTLDTKVCELLPAFAAGGKQRVTVRQLLTHTSGTYAGFLPPPPATPDQIGDLAGTVQAVATVPAAFIPGERVVYNPFASYAVLGQLLVVTDPTRRRLQDIAMEDLFKPLGMHDSSYGRAVDDPRRVPVSFTPANLTPAGAMTARILNSGLGEHSEHPAGGAFGTVDDVFRFAETLRQRGSDGKYRLLSQSLFDYACQNHTGEMSNGAWDFYREMCGLPDFPANFSLFGGYVRGKGHFLTGAGLTASPRTFYAVGGGSTLWLVDPERDLTFVFLSAGFVEGLAHFERLSRLSDLAIATCVD